MPAYNQLVSSSTKLIFCKNPSCSSSFPASATNRKKSCSQSCAVTIGNLKKYRNRQIKMCIVCNQPTARQIYTYCSIKCQSTHNYNQYITRWKQGKESGGIGISTRTLSSHIERYLHEKFGNRCVNCGWSVKHPTTKRVPLEINHIDGNADNNIEENLELLCPNCHSLTPNFRNLNKGNGRKWRLDKIRSSTVIAA